MISQGRNELSVQKPSCSIRLNWNWQNKFKGLTMIFQHYYKAKLHHSDAQKNQADNFSYIMEPMVDFERFNDSQHNQSPINVNRNEISHEDIHEELKLGSPQNLKKCESIFEKELQAKENVIDEDNHENDNDSVGTVFFILKHR